MPTAPSLKNRAMLEALRGAFRQGHTDDDARRVLGQIFRLTGIRFAILWDFCDCWGLGGNSQLVFVETCRRLREAPEDWRDFLYEPECWLKVHDLFRGHAGNVIPRWQRCREFGTHNFAWSEVQGEAD